MGSGAHGRGRGPSRGCGPTAPKKGPASVPSFSGFSFSPAGSCCSRFHRLDHYSVQRQLWRCGVALNWIMVALTLGGLLFTWWARIHLGRLWSDLIVKKAGHHVVDTGPYRLVRHPIYAGLIVAAFATAIGKGTLVAVVGAAILMVAFYTKARREERFLRAELGEGAYDGYAEKTPMLVPFVRIPI